jgi:hypothetical protein
MLEALAAVICSTAALVSLVSVSARNWCYSCGTVERVEEGEIIQIANVDAVFAHIAEKMVGYQKRLGEYPTLSARNPCPRAW